MAFVGAVALLAACESEREDVNGPPAQRDMTLNIPATAAVMVDSAAPLATVTTAEGDTVNYAPLTFSVTISDTSVVDVDGSDPLILAVIGKKAGTSVVGVEFRNLNDNSTLTGESTVTVTP